MAHQDFLALQFYMISLSRTLVLALAFPIILAAEIVTADTKIHTGIVTQVRDGDRQVNLRRSKGRRLCRGCRGPGESSDGSR